MAGNQRGLAPLPLFLRLYRSRGRRAGRRVALCRSRGSCGHEGGQRSARGRSGNPVLSSPRRQGPGCSAVFRGAWDHDDPRERAGGDGGSAGERGVVRPADADSGAQGGGVVLPLLRDSEIGAATFSRPPASSGPRRMQGTFLSWGGGTGIVAAADGRCCR